MDIVEWAENHLVFKNAEGKQSLLQLFDYQKDLLRRFAKNKFTVFCLPKRQGKTMLAAVAALWVAMTNDHANVIVLSTSQEHAAGVTFRRLATILKFTQNYFKKHLPTKAQDLSAKYFFSDWLAERCILSPTLETRFDFLYSDFQAFLAAKNAQLSVSEKIFAQLLKSVGASKVWKFIKTGQKSDRRSVYVGIGLKAENPDLQSEQPIKETSVETDYARFLFDIKIAQTSIRFPNGSLIEAVPCTVPAIAGRVYDLLIIDELALIEDEEVAEVAIAQSENPSCRILITSTASDTDHLLFRLYQQAQEPDSGIDFVYLAGEKAALMNPLISENWLKQQQRTMTETAFRNYFWNEFGAKSGGNVFKDEDIDIAIWDIEKVDYQTVLKQFEPLEWMVGMGIDRALPHSRHGDLSVAVVVMRLVDKKGRVLFVVLDVNIFDTGEYREITSYIDAINEQVDGLDKIQAEDYQCADLYSWALEQGYPMSLVTVTKQRKIAAFALLQRLFTEHRIIIPSIFDELISELRTLQYAGGKFSAPSNRYDDCVYALLWAIDALENVGVNFGVETVVAGQ